MAGAAPAAAAARRTAKQLRSDLAREVAGLPAALRSAQPAQLVDYLATVFRPGDERPLPSAAPAETAGPLESAWASFTAAFNADPGTPQAQAEAAAMRSAASQARAEIEAIERTCAPPAADVALLADGRSDGGARPLDLLACAACGQTLLASALQGHLRHCRGAPSQLSPAPSRTSSLPGSSGGLASSVRVSQPRGRARSHGGPERGPPAMRRNASAAALGGRAEQPAWPAEQPALVVPAGAATEAASPPSFPIRNRRTQRPRKVRVIQPKSLPWQGQAPAQQPCSAPPPPQAPGQPAGTWAQPAAMSSDCRSPGIAAMHARHGRQGSDAGHAPQPSAAPGSWPRAAQPAAAQQQELLMLQQQQQQQQRRQQQRQREAHGGGPYGVPLAAKQYANSQDISAAQAGLRTQQLQWQQQQLLRQQQQQQLQQRAGGMQWAAAAGGQPRSAPLHLERRLANRPGSAQPAAQPGWPAPPSSAGGHTLAASGLSLAGFTYPPMSAAAAQQLSQAPQARSHLQAQAAHARQALHPGQAPQQSDPSIPPTGAGMQRPGQGLPRAAHPTSRQAAAALEVAPPAQAAAAAAAAGLRSPDHDDGLLYGSNPVSGYCQDEWSMGLPSVQAPGEWPSGRLEPQQMKAHNLMLAATGSASPLP